MLDIFSGTSGISYWSKTCLNRPGLSIAPTPDRFGLLQAIKDDIKKRWITIASELPLQRKTHKCWPDFLHDKKAQTLSYRTLVSIFSYLTWFLRYFNFLGHLHVVRIFKRTTFISGKSKRQRWNVSGTKCATRWSLQLTYRKSQLTVPFRNNRVPTAVRTEKSPNWKNWEGSNYPSFWLRGVGDSKLILTLSLKEFVPVSVCWVYENNDRSSFCLLVYESTWLHFFHVWIWKTFF